MSFKNVGPARLPGFHDGILGYARKFGVPLEVEFNWSRSAYIVGNDGKKFRMCTAVKGTTRSGFGTTPGGRRFEL
jgi:hypothetical protein